MSKFIDQINSPKDLKKIKRDDLPKVAEEIRQELLEVISVNGGHLASNMGVVELTLAIHYVFDSPRDKLVWDVGHQSYVHKLLTGRKNRFYTLRQYEGLAGFTRREESPYDHWNCGHGGTSISAALAFSTARDQKNENNKVIAIIGDGSLTSGMALEGLNHTGHIKNDMIVILNDNEMSIAPNVGGMSAHLSQIMTGQVMTKIKGEIDQLLLAVPGIGKEISRYAHKIDEAIKGIFIPGRLFEDLGLRYIGPIDGHDVDLLINSLNTIKDLKGPTLIHVITQKGKGYKVAEEKSHVWHGAKPFDIATGEFHKKKANPAYTAVFAEALIELAKEDKKIIGLTAAMPDGTGIDKFEKVFPERTFDVGMAEQHCVGFAGAMALEGLRPVAAIYSTFLQRAYDQVVHDICLMNIPLTFAMDRAGIVGEDGSTHQGLYDIAYLRTLPNMVVMAPKDENELRHMLKTSIYHHGPSALRYPRGSALGVKIDPEMQVLEIGKAELIKHGKDLAIFAYGHMVEPSEKAMAMLEEAGISVALINARFAKPVDSEIILKYACLTKCLITVEEHSLDGGFGSAVLEALEKNDALANLRLKRIGVGNIVVEHGAPKILRKKLKLDPEGLFGTISKFYNKSLKSPASTPENGKKDHLRNGGKSRGKVSKKNQPKSKQPVHG